jgi:hypothetical protein
MEPWLLLLGLWVLVLPVVTLVVALVALSRANEARTLAHQRASLQAAGAKTEPDQRPILRPEPGPARRETPDPARSETPTPSPAATPTPQPPPPPPAARPAPRPPGPPPAAVPTPALLDPPAPTPVAARSGAVAAGEREALWGSRWATRLGLGFALLGAIFLGVYVARETPGWLRWSALLAASLGTLGLGHFFERRRPAFGRALFAGGLAALYLTAFAGYALPFFRLVESAAAGWWLQLAAALTAFGAAIVKRRPDVAYLTAGLGALAGIAVPLLGLHAHAIPYLLGLHGALLALSLARRWDRLALVALGVSFAQIAFHLAHPLLGAGIAPTPRSLLTMVFGVVALHLLAAWPGASRWVEPARRRLSLHLAASLGLLLLGLGYATLQPDRLGEFFAGGALAFLALAVAARLLREPSSLGDTWLLKAFSLAGLYWVHHYDGHLPAVALAVQSFGLLALWARHRRGALFVAWLVNWMAALGTLLFAALRHPMPDLPAWSALLAWSLLLAGLELHRLALARQTPAEPMADSRRDRLLVLTLLAGTGGLFLLHQLVGAAALPSALLLAGLASVLWAIVWRNPLSLVLSILTQAHLSALWMGEPRAAGPLPAAGLGILLVVLPLLQSVLPNVLGPRFPRLQPVARVEVEAIFLALAGALLLRLAEGFLGMPGPVLAPLAAGLGLALLGQRGWLRTEAAFAPLLAVGALVLGWNRGLAPLEGTAAALLHGAWMLPLITAAVLRGRLPTPLRQEFRARDYSALWSLFVLAGASLALAQGLEAPQRALAATGIAAVLWIAPLAHASLRLPGLVPAALFGAWVLAWGELPTLSSNSLRGWLAILAPAALVLAYSLPTVGPVGRGRATFFAILPALLLLAAPVAAGPSWEGWITASWAGLGMIWFTLGWTARSLPHRALGLGLLALAIGRAFLVDLDDTLARIIAFFALGLILVLIGFLYSRFERSPREEGATAD